MAKPTDIRDYYARRASEFEKVYARPERQRELAALRQMLPPWFAGEAVLEVACGTGYWTEVIAGAARSILATDVSDEMLDIARRKHYGRCPVALRRADAYTLAGVQGEFSAGLAAFWWSHVPRPRRRPFLEAFHARLAPGARVVLLDNVYVDGSSSPPAPAPDREGNTYSLRRLADGSEWRILKNYPTETEVREDLSPLAAEVEYGAMKHYWWARYIATPPPAVR